MNEELDAELGAYRVKVTVKNNKLLSAIERAGYRSCAEFCRWSELDQGQVGALIGLRVAPLTHNGEFSAVALGVMQALGAAPNDLWSDEQLTMALRKNTGERVVSADSVQALLSDHVNRMTLPDPESDAIRAEASDVVRSFVGELTPRQQEILRMRYEQELTLAQIAELLDLSPERVRQIEQKALRLLRHPKRSEILREFLETV